MLDSEVPSAAFVSPGKRVGGWEWGVCWLMFASTTLNYMDRQAVSLVRPLIKAEYRLGEEDFGWVLAAFYLTYALFQVPAGYLADRRDVRMVYAMAVAWWSLAGIATAFAPSLAILLICAAAGHTTGAPHLQGNRSGFLERFSE